MKKNYLDWRNYKRFFSSQATKDLDRFLDALPLRAGYNAVIGAVAIWTIAAGSILFASMEASKISELRAEFLKVEALQPPVPVLKYVPVPTDKIDTFLKQLEASHPKVEFRRSGTNVIEVGADKQYFNAFRHAVSHVENGGRLWNAKVTHLCAGRECKGGKKLQVSLAVSILRVDEAAKPKLEEG